MINRLFETYKYTLIPNGIHIYATKFDMDIATMCEYPPYQHGFPHWKCVLYCCANYPCIDIPVQELDRHQYNTSPSIIFHIYHLILRCAVHRRRSLDENKICCWCLQDTASVSHVKLYTRKELVIMEKYISDFHTSFYVPEIQKLAFNLPHIRILGNNHCDNNICEAFKRCRSYQYLFCHCDYSERVVASFAH